MRLRILGPIEAWNGGQRLALGGPMQLSLFAFLVLHANRAVSRDVLIDAVWGSEWRDPEKDNRLPMAVRRLRKALEPLNDDDGSLLRTVTRGYLLSVAQGELDADVFHAGVRAGIQALEGGSPEEAFRLLSEAEALWRGPALAEVALLDFAQGEIRLLDALRTRARECRIEADLRLGRHAELVAELEGILARDSTNETFAGQLIRALRACDRQADALAVYRRIVKSLAAQRLKPGLTLQELQRSWSPAS